MGGGEGAEPLGHRVPLFKLEKGAPSGQTQSHRQGARPG